jgi:hypothetical protein
MAIVAAWTKITFMAHTEGCPMENLIASMENKCHARNRSAYWFVVVVERKIWMRFSFIGNPMGC